MNIYLEDGPEGLASQTAVVVVKDEIAIAEHDAWLEEFFKSLLA